MTINDKLVEEMTRAGARIMDERYGKDRNRGRDGGCPSCKSHNTITTCSYSNHDRTKSIHEFLCKDCNNKWDWYSHPEDRLIKERST